VADSGVIKRDEMDDDSSDEEEQTFVDWGTPSVPKSPLRSNVVKKGTNRIATTVSEPGKHRSHVRKASEVVSEGEKEQAGYNKDSTRKKRKKVEKSRGGTSNDVVGEFLDL